MAARRGIWSPAARSKEIDQICNGCLTDSHCTELGEVTAALGDQMNHIAMLRDRVP